MKCDLVISMVNEGENIGSIVVESTSSTKTIEGLEKKLGIDTPAERVLEASLFVDWEILTGAIIAEHDRPHLVFGESAWGGWLNAKKYLKDNFTGEMSVDLIGATAEALDAFEGEGHSGMRSVPVIGGNYDQVGHTQRYLHPHQTAVLEDNPLIRATYTDSPAERVIVYPAAGDIRVEQGLSDEARQIYEKSGKSTEGLVRALLVDVCNWYNLESKKVGVDPVRLASDLQKKIVSVHPRLDRNGRLSRVIMNAVLEHYGQEPYMLFEPDSDLTRDGDGWELQVRSGGERYARAKQYLASRGGEVVDLAIMLGGEDNSVDRLRTIHRYVEQYLTRKCPTFSGDVVSHRDVRQWRGNLLGSEGMLRLFTGGEWEYVIATRDFPFLANGQIDLSRYSETTRDVITAEMKGCDLVPVSMMDAVDRGETAEPFLDTTEVYRGAVLEKGKVVTDEDLCRMFFESNGLTADYASLGKAGVKPGSLDVVPGKILAESMDLYNKAITVSLFRKERKLLGLRLAVDFYRRQIGDSRMATVRAAMKAILRANVSGGEIMTMVHDHVVTTDQNSPFASATCDPRIGYAYANGYLNDGGSNGAYGFIDDDERKHRTGLLMKLRLPKTGSVPASYAQMEVLLPGGVMPGAITQIDVFEGLDEKPLRRPAEETDLVDIKVAAQDNEDAQNLLKDIEYRGYPRPMREPVLVARRIDVGDNVLIQIIDKRHGGEQARFYRRANDTFEIVQSSEASALLRPNRQN